MTELSKSKKESYPIFLFLFICFSLFFVFAFPPLQKPDEPLHFERAFALASGQLVCKVDAKHMRGYFSFPISISAFSDAMMTNAIVMKPEGKFPIVLLRNHYPINRSVTTDLLYNCTLPFTGYIPLSLGILVAIPFNNLLISFYTARLFAALFYVIAIYLSLRVVSARYRWILMICSMLPMVLQQATAVSYDGVTIAAGFLLFSLFTRYLEKKTVSVRELLWFYAVIMVFIFTKPGYYLFFPLLFLPFRLVKLPINKKVALIFLLSAGIAGIIWYSLSLPI